MIPFGSHGAAMALLAHHKADALQQRLAALDPALCDAGEIERLRAAVEDLRARAVQAALRGSARQ